MRATSTEFADGEAVERDFDDVLGFRAGDQDVRRDLKFESPEFLLAGEMLCGFAACTMSDEREEVLGIRSGEFFFRMSIDPGAIAAEDVEQQKLCGERVGRNVRITQLGQPSF